VWGEGDVFALHAADEPPVYGRRACAAQAVIGLDREREGTARVFDMHEQLVRGVFDGVCAAHVRRAAVEDDGGGCEVEQQFTTGELTRHAQARFCGDFHLSCI
jgi:hypothetical protein